MTKANPGSGASLLGKSLPMTARHQVSAWIDHTIGDGPLAGFGLGGGVRHLAGGYGDAVKTLEGMSLRVTATNLGDRTYVSYCQGALQCYHGQGRTVLATLKQR